MDCTRVGSMLERQELVPGALHDVFLKQYTNTLQGGSRGQRHHVAVIVVLNHSGSGSICDIMAVWIGDKEVKVLSGPSVMSKARTGDGDAVE